MDRMNAGARAEWDTLRKVMVHEPGTEVFFALLSPSAYLYERFFNLHAAIEEHRALTALMEEEYDVRVFRLGPTISEGSLHDDTLMAGLAAIAEARLERRCGGEICDLPVRIRNEMANPVPLPSRDPGHLFDIVRLNPVLTHHPHKIDVCLKKPLHNLYFMRDQHAAADIGLISARMATAERQDEVGLCRLGLRSAGSEPVSVVREGMFEGGDFIPCDRFALVGRGTRTDLAGIGSFLASGVRFDEVAVVDQPVHPLIRGRDPMVNMHLDTYLNFPGEGLAVGCIPLLEQAHVTILHRTTGGYEKTGTVTDLASYLRARDFGIIGITSLEQLCYASNFLCMRNGECLVPDAEQVAPVVLGRLREKAATDPGKYGRLLGQAEHDYQRLEKSHEFFPVKKAVSDHGLSMRPVILTNATGGYGGAHCMTCVISR